jgi:AcrR family transcriptional regulator
MPKLWDDTIEAHRRGVRAAILDRTAALVAAHGLRAITMSQIAEASGIGRATLYKYFPSVEAILAAWHQQKVAGHLEQLRAIGDRAGDASARLEAVLEAYAAMLHRTNGHHDPELVASLHRNAEVAQAQAQLHAMVRDLLGEGARSGILRGDVPADELAGYCLHAVTAAGGLPSDAAVRRLVGVVMAGLRLAP